MKKSSLLVVSLSVFLGLMSCADSYAALVLRAVPERGGTTLRFGRIDKDFSSSREVRLRITATDNQQYQVYQRLVDPLRNPQGKPLSDNAFKSYALRGSSAAGTLYAQSPERMSFADQLIYTSSANGLSDNLTVVYSIDPKMVQASGDFFGRIAYTVRPIGSGSQQTVYLDVTVEASGQLKFHVRGSHGVDRVVVTQSKNLLKEGYAHIQFDGNLGDDIRIYQELNRFPQTNDSQVLNKGLLQFVTSGRTQGQLSYQTLTDITPKRELIYESNAQSDEFFVNFQLNQKLLDQIVAGKYIGQITYIVQTAEHEKRYDLNLEIDVEPVFFVDVDLPPGGLAFNDLLPKSPPITREVLVSVKSNLGKQYMLVQNVGSPLTNQKGDTIEPQYFTLKGQFLSGSEGKLSFDDYQPVQTGDVPIFISGPRGESAEFKMFYRLRSFPEIRAGDYTTSIRYSLEAL